MGEEKDLTEAATGSVEYLNPAGMAKNPAYTQVVVAKGLVKTVYIGAQTALDGNATVVGKGDLAAQTGQVLRNIQACLEAAGARPEHIVQLNIYVAQGQSIQPSVALFQNWWGNRPNPPANTVVTVAGFPHPDFLVLIDAIAVVPL